MRRGGRLLPRRVRAAALRLAKAQAMLGAPKLARQLDTAALGRDAKLCIAHLTLLVQRRTRHDWWLRAASWAALMVVICAAVLYALWHLRGALGLKEKIRRGKRIKARQAYRHFDIGVSIRVDPDHRIIV
jgi:hypothetical protein